MSFNTVDDWNYTLKNQAVHLPTTLVNADVLLSVL